jgi:hypothetical protein
MHPACGGLYILALLGFGAIRAHLYSSARGEGVKLKLGLLLQSCIIVKCLLRPAPTTLSHTMLPWQPDFLGAPAGKVSILQPKMPSQAGQQGLD